MCVLVAAQMNHYIFGNKLLPSNVHLKVESVTFKTSLKEDMFYEINKELFCLKKAVDSYIWYDSVKHLVGNIEQL